MMDKVQMINAAPYLYKNENDMTTEKKYKLLMDSLKKMRVAFAPEKAKDNTGIVKQAIKGWGAFCVFFDVYVKAEEREG